MNNPFLSEEKSISHAEFLFLAFFFLTCFESGRSMEDNDKLYKVMERYTLIFEHIKHMEHRYHTWMNYYSLFNGALLVAYCTILVSTGKVIELEGGYDGSVAQAIQGGAKVFYLNCTYWDILALIALLGVVASYAWYLSIIGHGKWIDSWRGLLQKEDKNQKIGIQKKLGVNVVKMVSCCGNVVVPHFHSTFTITKAFICSVLFAWIYVFGYSWGNHAFSWKLFGFTCGLGIVLICLEYFLHYIIGSDLTGFGKNGKEPQDSKQNGCICKFLTRMWKYIKLRWKCGLVKMLIMAVLLFIGAYLCYCFLPQNTTAPSYKLQLKHTQQVIRSGEKLNVAGDSLNVSFSSKK